MTRLQTEFARLFGAAAEPLIDGGHVDEAVRWIDAAGTVRALVLELARPANWEVLGRVWRGVQTELELPPPGIAVSGTDGLQLWFSLALPLGVAPAHAFLDALRARFLPEVPARRLTLRPSAAADEPGRWLHAPAVPACNSDTGNWSAFVAADLAPVFEETPWLDLPPNEEGQATLLRALQSIKPAAFEAAAQRLGLPAGAALGVTEAPVPVASRPSPARDATAAPHTDPRAFLLQVMNDAEAPLALRIDAAKALLPPAGG